MDETSTAERLKPNLASRKHPAWFPDFDLDDDRGGTRPFAAQYLPAEHPHPIPEQRLPTEPFVLPGIEPFRPASD